jgi:hypothetical protein
MMLVLEARRHGPVRVQSHCYPRLTGRETKRVDVARRLRLGTMVSGPRDDRRHAVSTRGFATKLSERKQERNGGVGVGAAGKWAKAKRVKSAPLAPSRIYEGSLG